MALATNPDFLHSWPGQTSIQLAGQDETSPLGSGALLTRELAPPLWMLTAQSRLLKPTVFALWQAQIEALDNGKVKFYGFDRNRYYPILYPKGSWPTGGTFGGAFNGTNALIQSVNANNKELILEHLPAGYKGQPGDMIAWTYNSVIVALHRVVEAFTASSPGGVTGSFEVRPHIRPTASVGTAVRIFRPACLMKLIPGSYTADPDAKGWGTISFQAEQTLATT